VRLLSTRLDSTLQANERGWRVLQKKSKVYDKGVCIWVQDGKVLSKTEIAYLTTLAIEYPDFKVVVEMGYDREVTWKPLAEVSGVKAGAF
jgi:hypothetical protein